MLLAGQAGAAGSKGEAGKGGATSLSVGVPTVAGASVRGTADVGGSGVGASVTVQASSTQTSSSVRAGSSGVRIAVETDIVDAGASVRSGDLGISVHSPVGSATVRADEVGGSGGLRGGTSGGNVDDPSARAGGDPRDVGTTRDAGVGSLPSMRTGSDASRFPTTGPAPARVATEPLPGSDRPVQGFEAWGTPLPGAAASATELAGATTGFRIPMDPFTQPPGPSSADPSGSSSNLLQLHAVLRAVLLLISSMFLAWLWASPRGPTPAPYRLLARPG